MNYYVMEIIASIPLYIKVRCEDAAFKLIFYFSLTLKLRIIKTGISMKIVSVVVEYSSLVIPADLFCFFFKSFKF